MEFIDWCEYILKKLIELSRHDSTVRSIGVDQWQLSRFLLEGNPTSQEKYDGSTFQKGLVDAVSSLQDMGLVEQDSHWKVTKDGRTLAADMMPLWWNICQEQLEPEHQQLLQVVNRLSPHAEDDHAWVERIAEDTLTVELGWSADPLFLDSVANDLEQWGFVCGVFYMGGMRLAATYRGLVWETKKDFTLKSRLIDDLVAEWETTSVDFKRDLHLDTADQKAEFVKDVLSIANTKASGRRWLIIGFDDRSHAYYGSPDQTVTQNRIEHVLALNTAPCVDVHYEVVNYRGGAVGMLEVLRDPTKLPYSAARSFGDRKRIEEGDVFVRHGSQVEKPTPLELQALQDEGDH